MSAAQLRAVRDQVLANYPSDGWDMPEMPRPVLEVVYALNRAILAAEAGQ